VAGLQVEPSEIAKLLVLVALAAFLARRETAGRREVLMLGVLGLPPTLLVLYQPDLGTAIVFASLLLGLLFLAGAPRLVLASILAGVAVAVPLLPHLFKILLYRVATAAAVAPDRFGFLLCAGAAVILFSQVVQNIGMNVCLTPIAGIPLPFISHGRSALLTYLVMLGLVQSVVVRRPLVSPGPAGRVPLTESGTIRLPV